MYRINEIFYSLQGEGFFAGTPALFIRFSGCNLACPFCDTKHEDCEYLSASKIIFRAQQIAPRFVPLVVLTGGEPSLQYDKELGERIKEAFPNAALAMETNGTFEIDDGIDFVTLSPKSQFVEGASPVLKKVSEIKVVFTGENDPADFDDIKAAWRFLQPCDTGDKAANKKIVEQCVEYIKEHPSWRLSLQTQKIIGVR